MLLVDFILDKEDDINTFVIQYLSLSMTLLFRPHVVLWVLYVLLFVVLVFLIPCTWISYIWDQEYLY